MGGKGARLRTGPRRARSRSGTGRPRPRRARQSPPGTWPQRQPGQGQRRRCRRPPGSRGVRVGGDVPGGAPDLAGGVAVDVVTEDPCTLANNAGPERLLAGNRVLSCAPPANTLLLAPRCWATADIHDRSAEDKHRSHAVHVRADHAGPQRSNSLAKLPFGRNRVLPRADPTDASPRPYLARRRRSCVPCGATDAVRCVRAQPFGFQNLAVLRSDTLAERSPGCG